MKKWILIQMGLPLLCAFFGGCLFDPQKLCYDNKECIEDHLCNKQNQCIEVDQMEVEILVVSLEDAVVGKEYSYELSTKGGLGPHTLSVESGPDWLTATEESNVWSLTGTPTEFLGSDIPVQLKVTDNSIDAQSATKDLVIDVLFCSSSVQGAQICSGHGNCNIQNKCNCDEAYAGDQCELCDEINGYERNEAQACVRYRNTCSPKAACGGDVYNCECVGLDCENIAKCDLVSECPDSSVCWSDGVDYGCDICESPGCFNGQCMGECNPADNECCTLSGQIISGCWYDEDMKLAWQNPPFTERMKLSDAIAECEALDLEDRTDWRLPNITELRSLIRGCPATAVTSTSTGDCGVLDDCTAHECWDEEKCAVGCEHGLGPNDGCYWDIHLQGECEADAYWSSSTEPNPHYAWAVWFTPGNVNGYVSTDSNYVRCVRP